MLTLSPVITIQVPAGNFNVPGKFGGLTGDFAGFLANTPQGEMPVLDFAFRVTDTQTGQLVGEFNQPVVLTAKDPSIVAGSLY